MHTRSHHRALIEEMGRVRGILLNSSVLFASDDDQNQSTTLQPDAESLLRKLRYSKIPTGITYGQSLSTPKVNLLQEMASKYCYECFILRSPLEDDLSEQVARFWDDNGGIVIHVVSKCREDLFYLENNNNNRWSNVIVDSEYVAETGMSTMLLINKLEELPLKICHLNKKHIQGGQTFTVGYVMKQSREEDFAKRGAFPWRPTPNGLIFLPLNYELPLSSQLQQVDAVLHKATDEISGVEMSTSLEVNSKVTYTRNLQELKRYIEEQVDCCVIDPFNNIYPILDRLKTQQILMGLEALNTHGRPKIRGPHFLKVHSFDDPNLEQRLVEAKLSFPNIVKPQVACGVADAHSMAIVFKMNDYKNLNVPLPAVVQEYVDHSCTLFKFYALGGKVFYAVKKSTPNASTLIKLSSENGLKPLLFDSLKSLPIAKEQLDEDNQNLEVELVTEAADWLRRMLDLTIFGFDIVIQDITGDHVIVDVNYLPSFKEVPDEVAIPAFWDALKEKIISSKSVNKIEKQSLKS